jgi:hypothetical protein
MPAIAAITAKEGTTTKPAPRQPLSNIAIVVSYYC